MKEIRVVDMQQIGRDGGFISPRMCFEQATADFIRHAKTDTNPRIVRMRDVPHWFYQSDQRTIQPYRLTGVFEHYVGPTEQAPIQLRNCRTAKDAVRRAMKILNNPSEKSVRESYEEYYEHYV